MCLPPIADIAALKLATGVAIEPVYQLCAINCSRIQVSLTSGTSTLPSGARSGFTLRISKSELCALSAYASLQLPNTLMSTAAQSEDCQF